MLRDAGSALFLDLGGSIVDIYLCKDLFSLRLKISALNAVYYVYLCVLCVCVYIYIYIIKISLLLGYIVESANIA